MVTVSIDQVITQMVHLLDVEMGHIAIAKIGAVRVLAMAV